MKNLFTLIAILSINAIMSQNYTVTSKKSLKIKPTLSSQIMYVPNLVLEEGSVVDISEQILYVEGDIIVKGKGEFILRPNSIVYCKGNTAIIHERVIKLSGNSKISKFKFFKNNLIKLDSEVVIIKRNKVIANGIYSEIKDTKIESDLYDIYIKGVRYISNQYLD